MATKIQLRGDTAANWASNNPTLAAREFAVETDTLRIKVGNGNDAYNTLQYASVPAYNGLDKAVAGNSLDARQGKVLKDEVNLKAPTHNPSFTGTVNFDGGISVNEGGTFEQSVDFNAGPAFYGKLLFEEGSSFKIRTGTSNGTPVYREFPAAELSSSDLNGSISLEVRTSNTGPILDSDSVLFGNTTGSIELPAAASNSGRVLRLICNSASTPYVFNPGQSDSIIKKDGSVITFPSMFEIEAPYGSATLISDGISKWYSI